MHAWDSMKSKRATSCHLMPHNDKPSSKCKNHFSALEMEILKAERCDTKSKKDQTKILPAHMLQSRQKMVIFIPGSGVQIYFGNFGNVFPVLEQAWHPIILLSKAENLILKVWQEFLLLILGKWKLVWIKIVFFYTTKSISGKKTIVNSNLKPRQLLIQNRSQESAT